MAQTEVGEVSEPADGGGSSTLPHKPHPLRNRRGELPPRRRSRRRFTGYGGRARARRRRLARSEWEALSDALALTGGAAAAVRETTEGLEVHPEKMRQNLDETGGMLGRERYDGRRRSPRAPGGPRARGAAARRAADGGRPFRDELAEPALREQLSPEEIDAALDPAGYLGSVGEFIDRALALYREGASP